MINEKIIIPYKDGFEHLVSEMQLIRLLLKDKVDEMSKRFESEIESTFKGYGITPAEAAIQLRKVEEGFDGNIISFDPELLETLKLRREKSLDEDIYLPLDKLQQLFSLNSVEVNILLACLLPEFYTGIGRVFGFLQDDATLSYPTVGFLMELFCKDYIDRKFTWQIFHPGSPLKSWNLIIPVGSESQIPPLKRVYRVDERIVAYLMDNYCYDGSLEGIVTLNCKSKVNGRIRYKSTFESIANGVMNGRECQIISLVGNDSEGADDFVEAVTNHLGWKTIKIYTSALLLQKEWNIRAMETLLREAVLQPAAILLEEDSESILDMKPLLRIMARKGMLIFHKGKNSLSLDSIEPTLSYIKLEFNVKGASERVSYWNKAIEKNNFGWPGHVAEHLTMRYPFSEKQVNTLFDRLRLRINDGHNNTDRTLDIFKKVINDYTQQPLDELANRIETTFDWNDLVVHKSVAEHLKAFRNTIAHQFTVYEKWGLGAKLPRGRGVTALFSGASGTGKTMAAEVIAHDIGINLYRIDLAGLVSKYIGETEKNIKKIFNSARGTNVLLFFDEADSLFARRTEIHDSHDRYANLEVNYLLQRLEEHDGPVILATNMRKNMDDAFLRRIHFIIEFPQPSEALRQIMWQKYLPPTLPRKDDVNISFLSKHFELSGGDIRNAALQAAFKAAEDGGKLIMEHLLLSLKREYLKLGKQFPGSLVNNINNTLSDSPNKRRRKREVIRTGH